MVGNLPSGELCVFVAVYLPTAVTMGLIPAALKSILSPNRPSHLSAILDASAEVADLPKLVNRTYIPTCNVALPIPGRTR